MIKTLKKHHLFKIKNFIFVLIFTLFAVPNAFSLSEFSNVGIGIPDDDTRGISDSIFIDTTGSIADIDVVVEVEHSWIGDLVITLLHEETGTSITLLDQIGANLESQDELGCGLDDIYVTFDEETPTLTESQCENSTSFAYGADGVFDYVASDFSSPTYLEACISAEYQCNANGSEGLSGTFKTDEGTQNGLDDFYGEDSFGTWTLTVYDRVQNDTGILVSWGVEFSDTNCGNGIREQAEECDDGNSNSNDGCSNSCEITYDFDNDLYYDDVDCDDGNININPGEEEVCGDGVDNNCDGTSVELITWYKDNDADDYGDSSDFQQSCTQPSQDYVEANNDCDDNDRNVNPGVTEIENDEDDNCNGLIDEGTNAFDDDGDNLNEYDGDCDDEHENVYPGAEEICDNLDNDCNGIIDDTLADCETTEDSATASGEDDEDSSSNSGNDSDTTSSGTTSSDAERRDNARNPLRSDVVAGCSLNAFTNAINTPFTSSIILLMTILSTLIILRTKKQQTELA